MLAVENMLAVVARSFFGVASGKQSHALPAAPPPPFSQFGLYPFIPASRVLGFAFQSGIDQAAFHGIIESYSVLIPRYTEAIGAPAGSKLSRSGPVARTIWK